MRTKDRRGGRRESGVVWGGVGYLPVEIHDLEVLKSESWDGYSAADGLSEQQGDVWVVDEVEVADTNQALPSY